MDFSGLVSKGGFLGPGGTGIDLAFGVYDRYKQEERFNESLSLQKDQFRHKYQYAVDDLTKAGLNPILAVTKGMTGGGGSAPNVPSAPSNTDYGMKAASAKALNNKAELDAAAAEKLRAEKKLIEGQTLKTGAETSWIETKDFYQKLMGGKARVEIEQIRVATDKLRNDSEFSRLKGRFFSNVNALFEMVIEQNTGADTFGAKAADKVHEWTSWLNSLDVSLLKKLAEIDSKWELNRFRKGVK